MANLALVFDILAKDGASGPFKNVGNAAERAGQQTSKFGTAMSGAMKLASGALLGAGIVEGFKALYNAADESRKIAALTAQVIKSTGGAAQVSAKQIGDLAAQIAKKTGVDDEAIQSGENLLLTFTNIKNQAGAGNDIFNQTTKIMTDMSVALGTDASGSAIQLGKALNDPVKGVAALTRVGVSFTAQQKDQIRTLVESGDVLGAQKVILAELGKEFGGAAEAAATPLGKLQQRLGDLAEQVGGYLVPAVDKAATFFNDKLLPAFSDIGSFVSGVGIPAFSALGTVVGAVADAFNALPGPLQAGVIALGAFALLKGPVSSAMETIALKGLYMKDAIAGATSSSAGFKGAMSKIAGAISPAGIAITGVTLALPFLIESFKSLSGVTDRAKAAQQTFADVLRETNGVINETSRAGAQKALIDAGFVDVLDRAGVSSKDAIDGLLGNAAAQDRVNHGLNDYLKLNPGTAHNAEAESIRQAREGYEELAGTFGLTTEQAEYFADAAIATGTAAAGTVPQVDEATAALEAWLGQLQGIGAGFVQPLSVYQDLLSQKQEAEQASAEETAAATESSSDSWKDYVRDVTVSLDEYATKLEEQLTAQDNWRANIATIAQRGGLEVAQALAAMGEDGVQIAAQMATGTDAEFQRMAGLIVEDTRRGGADAATEFDNAMKVMAAIGAAGGQATAADIAKQLGIGLTEVSRIAQQYGVELAGGINPILRAVGSRPVNLDQKAGRLYYGQVPEFADGGYTGPGGKYTPAGIVHGGEFVLTKEQTARLGINRIEEFANRGYASGGFVTAADVPRPYSTAPYQMPISTAADATMQKGFDEVTAWLQANGGALGTGAIGGGWQSIFNFVKARIPEARANSTFRPGDPGYHGRGKAVDFGFGAGPGGAGSAGLASINRLLHDTIGGNLAELIYDGLGDDRPDLKNGKPLTYNAATRAEHRNHVHAATYDAGGLLPPGLTLAYNGTGQSETIRTASQEAALGGPLEITGTLEIGGDGLARIVDGRIVSALTGVVDRRRYSS